MKGIVLAGGSGTRLYGVTPTSLTEACPNKLFDSRNKPFNKNLNYTL